MHDLPPETVDEEPLVPLEVLSLSKELDAEEQTSFPKPSSSLVTRQDLFTAADFFRSLYPDGLTWTDLGTLILKCSSYLTPCHAMSNEEKVEAIQTLLDYVVVQMDSQFVPKILFDDYCNKFLSPLILFSLEKSQIENEGIFMYQNLPPGAEKKDLEELFKNFMYFGGGAGENWDQIAKFAFLLTLSQHGSGSAKKAFNLFKIALEQKPLPYDVDIESFLSLTKVLFLESNAT